METKEIKNWEWIKSVEVQYMGFLTQYLGTATDSKGFVELMKQLRLDEAIAYLEDDLGKDASEPNYHKFQFYTKTMQFTKKEEWEAISKGSMSEIEQLEGKELLDTLEALRTILHPTVRALLESYTIDMVIMPIPGIISFLLIGKSKQKIEPSTIMFRIKYLMEGCIDHEPTSLLKEYHIHLIIPPKDNQENPFVTQIILISKKLTTITIK